MFTVIIPARYASTRLPGKPLADICGKPMIVRVMEQAKRSGAARVIVATDTQAVFDAVIAEGGEACMTREDHQSGTERLAEVIDHYQFADDEIIVNVQGDEPLIPDSIIAQVAENLAASEAGMATLAVKITTAEEAFNPNAVKVVMDKQGYALYFSRATFRGIASALCTAVTVQVIIFCVISAFTLTVPGLSAVIFSGKPARWRKLRCSSSCVYSGTVKRSMSRRHQKHRAPVLIPRKILKPCADCLPPAERYPL